MKALFSYFNLRTFFSLAASVLATWLTLRYQLKINVDLLLFGLFLAFPLHFALQSAFKRRERALEYFSKFKGSLLAVHYSLESADEFPPEGKSQGRALLANTALTLVEKLEARRPGFQDFQRKLDELFGFILEHREQIGGRTIKRIVRYLNDTAESSTFLVSLVSHRTMIGMQFYMTAFIFLFPFIQAPLTFYRLDEILSGWSYYAFMAVTSLVLVTLSNFQVMVEYPFDPKGVDNVKMRDFLIEVRPVAPEKPMPGGTANQ
jgi:hypothetical protein